MRTQTHKKSQRKIIVIVNDGETRNLQNLYTEIWNVGILNHAKWNVQFLTVISLDNEPNYEN